MEKKFRINSQKLSITLPQSKIVSREVILLEYQKVFEKYGGIKEYLIAQEEHKDTGIHYHVYLELNKKIDIRNEKQLDILGEHGNYQSTKCKKAWIDYLLKEDKEPMMNLDYREWLRNTKQHLKRQANVDLLDVLVTKGVKKACQDGDIHISQYDKMSKNIAMYLADGKMEEREELPTELENPWEPAYKVNTDLKKCHLWIYSSVPSVGKTTWALSLMEKYRSEYWNYLEIYQPQILKTTEIVILDEFRGQLKISQLNMLCDGTMYLTGKGMTSWKLNSKPVVIVLSNKRPEEIYKNSDTSLIEARFNIIDITNYKKL